MEKCWDREKMDIVGRNRLTHLNRLKLISKWNWWRNKELINWMLEPKTKSKNLKNKTKDSKIK